MKLITLDMETFYSADYSLSKLTTEAYIRDPRFEVIMMSYMIDNDRTHKVIGYDNVALLLDALDIEHSAVLCHHAHFDGFILNHHFGKRPKVWFDTLSMARALHGHVVGNGLGKLVEHYGVGTKGNEVVEAKGKRLADFTHAELEAYAAYCCNDTRLTKAIFDRMVGEFQKGELKIIDMVVRMFTEPALYLDEEMMLEYVQEMQANNMTLLIDAGVTLDEVRSDEKFAAALQRAGILNPPTKLNSKGETKWAFAKTDKGLIELAEHELEQVQALVAARLGNKTTANQSRAARIADMAPRGPAPIYLKYSGAAQTHRLSGGDKMNWQNMQRGGKLRDAIYVGPDEEIVVVDSKNIDARCLDWLSMQEDALQVYRDFDAGIGPDVYCVMAGKIYNKVVTPEDVDERFFGKQAKLQLGYQAGAERFRESCRIIGKKTISLADSQTIVDVYRAAHPMVKALWNRGQDALHAIMVGPDSDNRFLDPRGLLKIEKGAILLPNGLRIRYPKLSREGREWSFESNRGERTNLYGGKVVADVCQALARIVALEQTLEIHKHVPVRMSVHDEAVFIVPKGTGKEWLAYAKGVMSTPPWWAPDLPVAASGGIGQRYGDAK